jgi:[ribosomal protein S18]-alanine N-acetyltransferase
MVKLRRAGPADLARIDSVERASFDINRFEPELIEMILGHDDFVTWLAEEGECIGYASLLHVDREKVYRLISIAVLPEWRGHGVGQALLEKVKIFVEEDGGSKLTLEVRISNVPAINLYLRSGFRIKGMMKAYYTHSSLGGAEDALYMVYEPGKRDSLVAPSREGERDGLRAD